MKKIIFLSFLLLSLCIAQAQVSLRVKDSPRSKEIEITTKGRPGTGKGNAGTQDKPPVNDVKTTAVDTAARPFVSRQDDNYNGKAKTYVTTFWRQVEALKSGNGNSTTIQNMERALGTVKEKDPSYNTGNMEAELKTAKESLQKKEDAKKTPGELTKDTKLNEKMNGYNGPASNQVKYFWDYALMDTKDDEPMFNKSMREMEYAIVEIKRKDPAYNTGEMEAEFKKRKDEDKAKKLAQVRASSGDKERSRPVEKESDDPTVLLEKLFIEASIGVDNNIDQTQPKIDAYKARAQRFLAMDYSDALVKKGRYAKANISGFAANTNRELGKVDAGRGSKYLYYLIQYNLAYWDAAQKVFPEEIAYADMYKKLNAAAEKMGSLEQVAAVAAKDALEKIKNTKLPAPVVMDANFEKLILESFDRYFAAKNVKAVKSVLTQDGWTIVRNSLTGIVMGRERSAKMAYRSNEGKCYLLDDYIFIHQEYVGNSFTNTKVVFNGLFGSEMLCENVK
ncbi:MAG: hypothetical protein ABI688_03945 [Bacteroidota bacterium]